MQHAVFTNKDSSASLEIFESIDWAMGKEPAIVTKMNEDRKRMQEAKKLAADLQDMPSRPSCKPLFATGGNGQQSFFKMPPIQVSPFETTVSALRGQRLTILHIVSISKQLVANV